MENTTTTSRTIDRFESQPCSRCGGSGSYSYTSEWGSTCFKCGFRKGEPGTGYQLTKAGAAAREAWIAANTTTKPAADVQVGDVIAPYNDSRRYTVTDVQRGHEFGRSRSGDGPWKILDTMLTTGRVGRAMASTDMVTVWLGTTPLPPAMEPGTDRRAEMRAYVKSVDKSVDNTTAA